MVNGLRTRPTSLLGSGEVRKEESADTEDIAWLSDLHRSHAVLKLCKCTPDSSPNASSMPYSITASFDSSVIDLAFFIKHRAITSPGPQALQLVLMYSVTAFLNRSSKPGFINGTWPEDSDSVSAAGDAFNATVGE